MTFLSIAGSTVTWPTVEVSIDWANAPTSASTTWTDVTTYVRSWGFKRGADNELGRPGPGEFSALLSNRDGRFDPDNASGAYYPNVKPMRRVRVRLQWAGITYDAYLGVMQGYPLAFPEAGLDATVEIHAYDLTSVLALAPLETVMASLAVGSLTYTAKGAGASGNDISVEYRVWNHATYHAKAFLDSELHPGSTETKRIIVVLGTSDTVGTIHSRCEDVMAAIRANGSTDSLVDVTLTGAPQSLESVRSRAYLAGGTYAEERSSVRIANVLDDVGVPSVWYSLETGYRTVQEAGFKNDDHAAALGHLQDIAETEDGRFYADKAGVLTSENAFHRVLDITSGATVGDQAGEVPYRDLTFTHDVSEVWNTMRMQVKDGDVEEVTDSASIASYYPRTFERTLALAGSDRQLQAHDRADYYLDRYAEPHRRTPHIEIQAPSAPSLWPYVLGRDISDRVTRIRRPSWGTISEQQHIEAISMNCDAHGLSVAWQLSPVDPNTYWQVGDTTYGKIGTTARLAWG